MPWGLAALEDGRVLVSERETALVKEVTPEGSVRTLGEVPGVEAEGEGGLLGLTFDPAEEHLYAYRTTGTGNEVVRLAWDGRSLGEPEVVLDGIDAAAVHDGGRLTFGPDGMLYVGTGDAGDESSSQDPDSLNGKVLRVAPDGSVPSDNPDPSSPVFSSGHRNVQGLAFDSAGRLWASEFGQNEIDELNLLVPGGNYGWPEVEGSAGREEFVDPKVEWTPAEASPSGVAVLDDVAYVAALRGQRVWQVELRGEEVGETRPLLEGELGRVRHVAAYGPGLLVLTNNTSRGEPSEDDDQLLLYPVG